jgi:hypothetical protein
MNQASSVLNSLRDINDVTPLTEADAPLVDEIVAVLAKYNALERFGLMLLHQHFAVTQDEVLLETTDVTGRTQIIRPVPKSTLESMEYIETSWRLDSGHPVMHCSCATDHGTHTGQHVHNKAL